MSPGEVVVAFFDAYRSRDIEQMVAWCGPAARIAYVPMGADGEGAVEDTGRSIWKGLFEAFPDLTNEVGAVVDDGKGGVAAEVVIGGTQRGDYAGMPARDRTYRLPHGFFFTVRDERIERVTAYWDNASFQEQLQ